jgi:hypothetical protein
LDYCPVGGGPLQRIAIAAFPFRIGRSSSAHYAIDSGDISRLHAEIVRNGQQFWIRDLGSSNGTFVNGKRIGDLTELHDGAVVHIATIEFQFGLRPDEAATLAALTQTGLQIEEIAKELLDPNNLEIVFQPLVALGTGEVFGYEALGRCKAEKFGITATDFFRVADAFKLSGDLSRRLRSMPLSQLKVRSGSVS